MSISLGLGGYSSSEDESSHVAEASHTTVAAKVNGTGNGIGTRALNSGDHVTDPKPEASEPVIDAPATAGPDLEPAPGPAPGPALGPNAMPAVSNVVTPTEPDSAPGSPYTSARLQIRNLTMPPVPNFDIPPSPPGSPPLDSTAKFQNFLKLKRDGVHFNKRLQQSSALRNPQLLQNLMEYAGISNEDQYASSLPEHLAVPTKYPSWAYADELVKEHRKIAEKSERESRGKRPKLDFVGGTSEASSSSLQRPDGKKSRFDKR